MLLCDVVLDGVQLDWSIHVPFMLHIVFLGLDHTRLMIFFYIIYIFEFCESDVFFNLNICENSMILKITQVSNSIAK